jgi:hypothetical protein
MRIVQREWSLRVSDRKLQGILRTLNSHHTWPAEASSATQIVIANRAASLSTHRRSGALDAVKVNLACVWKGQHNEKELQ